MLSDVHAALSGTHPCLIAGLLVSPAKPCPLLPSLSLLPVCCLQYPLVSILLDQRVIQQGCGPAMGTQLYHSLINRATQSPAHTACSETRGTKLCHATGTQVSIVQFSSYCLIVSTKELLLSPLHSSPWLHQSFIHCTALPCSFREVLM